MFYNKLKNVILGGLLIGLLVSSSLWAKPLKVVAITEDFASIAKSIGAEHIEVSSLVWGSRNLHNFEPRPSMITRVKEADLLIRLGMGQDNWIMGLVQTARNSRVFWGKTGHLDCSVEIQKLNVPTGQIDGRMGDVHAFGNPHYWLNPLNGKIIAKQIMERLIILDPSHQAVYQENYRIFCASIDQKFKEWQKKTIPLQSYRIVTYHQVWNYFFDAFGLTCVGQLEPVPGVPPTTAHMMSLQKTLADQGAPTLLLMANFYPENIGRPFAKRVGAKFVQVPSNVGENGIKSYTELFDYIIASILKETER